MKGATLFNWDDVTAGKAAKALAQLFVRAGAGVIKTESDNRVRRTAGVSYKTLHMTFADGQQIELSIKQTGDIAAVKLNGSIVPIKNQDDHRKSVGELVKHMDAGRAKFQASLARKRAELPKGIKTAAPKLEAVLTERVNELDAAIAEKTARRDALKSELEGMPA